VGFHTEAEATAAAEGWATQFQKKGVADDAPEVAVSLAADNLFAPPIDGGGTPALRVAKLLQLTGLCASTNEATRKLNENAVSINGEKFIGKVIAREAFGESGTIRLGKKTVRVKWVE
ncbi:MAG: tyrosine--tRNA ligase, partial [Bryocella sp.]